MTDLKIIEAPQTKKENVSLAPKEVKPIKEYKVPKVTLSEGIKAYEEKIRKVKPMGPYDYNSIAINSKTIDRIAPPSETIQDSTYNTVGKFLGIDTHHDWAKYSDKVQVIVNWAKTKSGFTDTENLLHWLDRESNIVPSFGMSNKKVDQLYLYAKLQLNK